MLNKKIIVTAIIVTASAATLFCGCGSARMAAVDAAPVVSESTEVRESPVASPVPTARPDTDSEPVETIGKESESVASEEFSYRTVEAISGIAGLRAEVEKVGNKGICTVDTDYDRNPYDVVWDYGREYGRFIDAVDEAGMWDVLFDIGFYTEHYPMLALQYHGDEALLLEHFQTVGIHEGRQGSDAFNVAAYMEHCGDELADAFGENYECYYLYWALNQDSESQVDTRSDGHPVQMAVKLTALQSTELEHVNGYREEVGAAPVEAHPELMALAGYRAWSDYTGTYTCHEWFRAHRSEMLGVLDAIGADTLSENTVYGATTEAGPTEHVYYGCYRDSKDHYETMVSQKYTWFGCSNTYWGDDGYGDGGLKYCQYDLYTDTLDLYAIGVQ